MKKALIITYYWPPGSGPGVQRWLKFCKYLPENGWEPIVITVRNGSYPATDPSLLDEVPAQMSVFKTKTLEPFAIYNALRGKKGKTVEVAMGSIKGNESMLSKAANYVRANYFIPDARIGWNRFAKKTALEVIRIEKPNVIITTGPPHSTHLVGFSLNAETQIPWIADFRDPWSTIYYNAFLNRTRSSKEKDKKLEQMVVKSAHGIIAATPGLKAEFEKQAKAITFIPNGYDESDFKQPNSKPTSVFTLAYVGNLKAFQNIEKVWSVLAELKKESLETMPIRFQITGNVADEVLRTFERFDMADMVDVLPFVPHKQAIERMYAAQMLLLPIPKSDGNQNILTGKIFEYLATKRPILAVGPTDGNAAILLAECGKSAMIDYTDHQGIKNALKAAMLDFQSSGESAQTGNENYRKYSREGTTKLLKEFIETIAQ